MGQVSIADEIFAQIKQVKTIFSNEMAVYSSGRLIRIDPAEFVVILRETYKAMTCIGLYFDDMDQNIQELGVLASRLRTFEEITVFSVC